MGRGNKTQKSALKNQRVTPHGTGISGDKEGVFAGESDSSVPHPDRLPKGKAANVQELQAALDERYPDGRWLRLLEVLGVTGVADSVQIREGTGLSREQTENLLKGLMELDGRIVRLLPFTVPRAGSRGRPAAVYGLGEVGAAMLRAAGYADARTCGLNDVRAVAHARAVLDVRLLAQRAGLEVWTEREFSSAAEDGIVIRPDNAVRLADGTCAFFEVEQDARLPQLRRIVDSLRRRAVFYRSGGVTGVSRTVRVLFAVGEGKAWERTMEVWRKAVVMVAEESGGDLPFRLERCSGWDPEVCPQDRMENALQVLQELRAAMEQYTELDRQRPSTLDERRRRDQEMTRLEERILELYGDLNQYLLTPGEGAPAAPEPEKEIAAKEERAEVKPEMIPEEPVGPEEPIPEMPLPPAEELAPLVAVPAEPEAVPEAVLEMPIPPVEELAPPVAVPAEPEAVPEAVLEMPIPPVEELAPPVAAPAGPEAVPEALSPEEKANRMLLSSLAEGDGMTAYWLAWAMEGQHLVPVFPAPLLKAVQGAFWGMRLWPERPFTMLHELREAPYQYTSGDRETEQWMSAAAALYLALVDPSGGWGDWLNVHSGAIPALKDLAEVVRTFTLRGWPLSQEDIEGAKGKEEREKSLRAITEKASGWLSAAPRRRTTYQRASDVWRNMVSPPDGDLYRWFQIVVQDQRNRVGEVEVTLRDWRRSNWVDDRIQEIDQSLVGRKLTPIEGIARRQIIRWVEEACDLAEAWIQAVRREQQLEREEWIQENIVQLLRNAESLLPVVVEQVDKLLRQMDAGSVEYAALRTLHRSVISLQRILLSSGEPISVGRYEPSNDDLLRRSLEENLIYRLLWVPGIPLEEGPAVNVKDAPAILQALTDPTLQRKDAEEALLGWIERRDYRFVDFLLPYVPPVWKDRYRESLRQDIASTREEMDDTVSAVEQALLDGLISEDERGAPLGTIEAVRKELARVEHQAEEQRVLPNLCALSDRLRQVREELEEKRRGRLQAQRAHWERIRDKLPRHIPDEQQVSRVREVVETRLDQGAIRATDEYLAHLEGVLRGELTPESLFGRERRDHLREFRDALPGLIRFLEIHPVQEAARLVLQDPPPPELGLPRLPRPRLEEIARALSAWYVLKTGRPESEDRAFPYVVRLMEYLGFRVDDRSPVSIRQRQPGFRHWRVQASPQVELVPVPQFGSERGNQYDVIGVWDRPGFDKISAHMQRTVDAPAIMFYFGRLLPRQREDLLEAARNQKEPVLILDEALLVFLAREYDVRLEAFLSCALPFTNLNPYVPFAAGVVPPEMFVGRRKALQELLDPRGPAIVYGGRQLGKSALLRQVWREFHNPRKGQFAILEDIKSLGDPRSGQDYERAFWDRLAMALSREGFPDIRSAPADPDRLLERIVRIIQERDCRLIVLLDEADNFLEADAQRNFRVVSRLKGCMDQTERRFKVIMAGLHNVQRFQRIPNQPLAHLGTPIEVGPLEPDAARELLERPLRVLGYRLGEVPGSEDPAVLLHILSYTNYHPGLIQLFGRELVNRLHDRHHGRSGLPPFPVTRSDVDSVYRDPDLRKAIRDRFNWTLALDERYEAIALTMILEQWDTRNGFDRLWTSEEIRKQASYWWERGFSDVDMDRFRGYLDEMCGLGVLSLVPTLEGERYRLRSPNVVHLIGTREELEERLLSLAGKEPPSPLKMESHHALLDGSEYSPLSYAQESILRASRSGVGMVFGSEAMRIGLLKDVTRRFPESPSAWEEINIPARDGVALKDWLSKRAGKARGFSLRVYYRNLEALLCTPEEIEGQIREALKFCSSRAREIRVIFVLGPLATWQWFQLPRERREEVEARVGAVVSLKQWDLVGISQRMEQHRPELIATETNRQEVHRVTRGWPFLMDEFFRRCRSDNPIPDLKEFEKELRDPQNPVRRKFLELLGIPPGLPSRFILALLNEQRSEDEWVPWERDLAGVLIEGEEPERVESAVDYLVRMSVLRRREGFDKTRRRAETEISLDPVLYRLWPR